MSSLVPLTSFLVSLSFDSVFVSSLCFSRLLDFTLLFFIIRSPLCFPLGFSFLLSVPIFMTSDCGFLIFFYRDYGIYAFFLICHGICFFTGLYFCFTFFLYFVDLLWSRDLLLLRSEVRLEYWLHDRLLFLLSLSRALSFSLSSSSLRLFLSLSSLSLSLSFSLSSRSCFSFFKRSSRSGSSVLFLNFS